MALLNLRNKVSKNPAITHSEAELALRATDSRSLELI